MTFTDLPAAANAAAVDPCSPDCLRVLLHPLAREFPNVDAAVSEIARFAAELTLPRGTIHVISDVHGEDKKLRHVINNASGTLRPLVERLFKDRMTPREFQEFLTLIFYPAEVVEAVQRTLATPQQQRDYAQRVMQHLLEVVRVLSTRRSAKHAARLFPAEYRELLGEMLNAEGAERDPAYVVALVDAVAARGRALHLVHLVGRLIRNLAIDELIIAGDCWDRGPRGDRVVEYLMQQPNVAFVWGNHDAAWLGAALGHEALICHVLRVSLRYRRLSQLEEGYGIPVQPLEVLTRRVYADDPATRYYSKMSGMREPLTIARMQKAAAVMQFKLEGQAIARHPEWRMDHRRLLHRIDWRAGTIEIDGQRFKLEDTRFPTIDPADPYALSPEERECLDRVRNSFLSSEKLQDQMRWMVRHGRMDLVRDEHLIFHGCVPVDERGAFLPMHVDGKPHTGRALFEAIEQAVFRLTEGAGGAGGGGVGSGPARGQRDLDLLWYLWSGPASPLFGKDRIATLERDLIADKRAHEEHRNAYFTLIHEPWFCERVLAEFGVDPGAGLIVNGHVPVKIERGESPVKRSGKAITIDGAFSEAYGDRGYTLVIEPDRTFLAEHSHFESVEAAVSQGADIIPTVTTVREWRPPRRIADTHRGRDLRCATAHLERLIDAYRNNDLQQRPSRV